MVVVVVTLAVVERPVVTSHGLQITASEEPPSALLDTIALNLKRTTDIL